MSQLFKLNYLFFIALLFSWQVFAESSSTQGKVESPVSTEIKNLFEADQKAILEGHGKSEAAFLRRQRILELVAQGQIDTAEGLFYAAIMLQHTPKAPTPDNPYKSQSPENHLLAFYLSKTAYERGFEIAGWYAGAAMDRYLLSQGKAQRYGTHWRLNAEGNRYIHDPVEPDFPDAERAKLGIEPLADIKKIVAEENQKLQQQH